MLITEKKFDGITFQLDPYKLEDLVFFDIETTGFVAEKSFLYLIGCSYYQSGSWHLIQWFALDPSQESEIITALLTFLKQYKVCIHFNGTTFDIPYLKKKCSQLGITCSFDAMKSVDLYKIATSLKSILHLDRCNQKAVEKALHVLREDKFSGGDLIQVYANYIGLAQLEKLQKGKRNLIEDANRANFKTPNENSETLLKQLLLHNHDDLIGLQAIASLFHYQQLYDGTYTIQNISLDSSDCICFTLKFRHPLPLAIDHVWNRITLTGSDCLCCLKIPLFEGTLRYYLEDYKDYYYLPYEDTVVHKSVGESIDKSYRVRATKENCFLKKVGIFLPQFDSIWNPLFQSDRKNTIKFLECTDERLMDSNFLIEYSKHIIHAMLNKKKG